MCGFDSRILPIWINICVPLKQLGKFKLFANTSTNNLSLPLTGLLFLKGKI